MRVVCAHCGAICEKPSGHVNRSIKRGAPIFCSKACFGLSRRLFKHDIQKRAEKREYDRQYRAANAERLREQKAAYFRRTYDPVAAAEHRKKRMAKHVEYCRRPEYRSYKAEYDKRYRACRDFGVFAECSMLLADITREVLSRADKYEIYLASERLNKKQRRRRAYDSFNGGRIEAGAVGDSERHQKRQDAARSR